MTLLDDVFEANGGLARWNSLKSFTLHLSVNGALFARSRQAGRYKDMVAEGSTHTQFMRFAGFDAPGVFGLYAPDCVTIESQTGQILRTWREPTARFLDPTKALDDCQLIFFCGFAVWNFLTTPFLLARPDVKVEELPPWHEREQQYRRLRVVFPPGIVTHSSEQVFYFDDDGLQRRTDHDLLGTKIAHYSWAHQKFNGIVVPTLRRSVRLRTNGSVIRKPALIDVEIFDASFE